MRSTNKQGPKKEKKENGTRQTKRKGFWLMLLGELVSSQTNSILRYKGASINGAQFGFRTFHPFARIVIPRTFHVPSLVNESLYPGS